jgi:hypothetical protein
MDPVTTGALGELIATTVAAAAGESWKRLRSTPEAQSIKGAVNRALVAAVRDAYRNGAMADDDWVAAVARVWERAFTAEVSHALIGCLADVQDGQREFAVLADQALRNSGCDITQLEQTFWIEQFLAVLPQFLFEQLRKAAFDSDSPVRI